MQQQEARLFTASKWSVYVALSLGKGLVKSEGISRLKENTNFVSNLSLPTFFILSAFNL
jgi:hypothetical protein